MRNQTTLLCLLVPLMLGLASCSSDDAATPTTPGGDHDSAFAGLAFADYSAAAREVLPPLYVADQAKEEGHDIWRDGQYSLLGKVFSDHEPMSIHRNINDHDQMMSFLEIMRLFLADYELEHGEIPDGPFDFTHPQYGSGTMTVQMVAAEEPVAVPAVCQTVFGCTEVAVDYLLRIEYTMDSGEEWSSPYFGISASDQAQVLYYWDVNHDEDGTPSGSQLFLARKDVNDDSFEIAGATFKPDGPGDEGRCNWTYHLTGDTEDAFTYNMGWYSESPAFQLFGCVQGSGDKDTEFGLRYHHYTDSGGFDSFEVESVSEQVFGPVGDEPYALIDEPMQNVSTYISPSAMFVVGDSPLAEIPNPFLEYLQ